MKINEIPNEVSNEIPNEVPNEIPNEVPNEIHIEILNFIVYGDIEIPIKLDATFMKH